MSRAILIKYPTKLSFKTDVFFSKKNLLKIAIANESASNPLATVCLVEAESGVKNSFLGNAISHAAQGLAPRIFATYYFFEVTRAALGVRE
jgi:hypothetical protein